MVGPTSPATCAPLFRCLYRVAKACYSFALRRGRRRAAAREAARTPTAAGVGCEAHTFVVTPLSLRAARARPLVLLDSGSSGGDDVVTTATAAGRRKRNAPPRKPVTFWGRPRRPPPAPAALKDSNQGLALPPRQPPHAPPSTHAAGSTGASRSRVAACAASSGSESGGAASQRRRACVWGRLRPLRECSGRAQTSTLTTLILLGGTTKPRPRLGVTHAGASARLRARGSPAFRRPKKMYDECSGYGALGGSPRQGVDTIAYHRATGPPTATNHLLVQGRLYFGGAGRRAVRRSERGPPSPPPPPPPMRSTCASSKVKCGFLANSEELRPKHARKSRDSPAAAALMLPHGNEVSCC